MSYGSDLLDPNLIATSHPDDQSFIPDRSKLRSSLGGASIRPLDAREHFLNCVCNVLPQLSDRTDESGTTIPGLFSCLTEFLGEDWTISD
jgi:hypothetical protein